MSLSTLLTRQEKAAETKWRRAVEDAKEFKTIKQTASRHWGDWLSTWSWSWFVTLTFADPSLKAASRGYTQRGWRYCWSRWAQFEHALILGQFGNGIAQSADYRWFVGLELQERGVPHFHALFGGTAMEGQWRLPAHHWLLSKAGINKLLPYDANLGATWYLTKYVTKELSDWRCYGLDASV